MTSNAEATLTNYNILKISDRQTLQLIDLYQKEECLWNSTLSSYKMREKRVAAARRIADKLNIPHFTAQHVLIKFKNLRNSYSQELKKIAQSMKSAEEYKPKVFWFSKLDSFIRPHLKPSRGAPYETLVYKMNSHGDSLPDCSNASEQSGSDDDSDSRKRKSTTYRAAKRAFTSHNEHSASTPEQEEHATMNMPLYQTLNDISTYLRVLMSHNDDQFDVFGKYVAALVRSMPPARAVAIQAQVIQMVTAALGDNYTHLSTGTQSDQEAADHDDADPDPLYSAVKLEVE